MEQESKAKGIGLFGLVGLVVSSCIGSGVFALTGQLANAAAPGSALIAWVVCGAGFLMLALSLANLGAKRSDIDGIFVYAEEGFGPFAGFVSGWGYWLSAWLGNVGFATMVIQVLCGLNPGMFGDPTAPNIAVIVLVSAILWVLTFLVINGVESAAFLNAIVMAVKIVTIVIFIIFSIMCFNAGIFTADFWGNVYNNAVAAGSSVPLGEDAVDLGSVGTQVTNCILVMMWVFIGIEGATVMSARAEKKSDVGKATVLGLVVLLVLYIGASVLPYGVMPYDELMALDKPATVGVFEYMAPGWGGTFISVAIIISVLGSWLSFTMLPAETSSLMSERKLLPDSWNKMNKKHSPQMALIIVGACTQLFLIIALAAADAYTFAISMCTVTIVITWALAAAFQVKYSLQQKETGQAVIGIIALLFQVVGVMFTGWGFLLLACLGYIPGLIFYYQARKADGKQFLSTNEKIVAAVICVAGIVSIPLTMVGIIPVF